MSVYPPLLKRQLPDAPHWSRVIGVGVVSVGLAIGAGELILWPHLVTQHGAGILWGALIGISLQAFINYEVARHALATGESFFTSSARLNKWLAPLWLLIALILYIWPGWASSLGVIAKSLFGFGDSIGWAWATLALVLVLTFSGKQAYRLLESTLTVVVPTFFVLLVIVSVHNLNLQIVGAGLAGLVNFGWLPQSLDKSVFFSAVVFAGTGGLLNLCVSLWYRDKQAGMAAYVETIKNPLTAKDEVQHAQGFTFDAGKDLPHWKKWLAYVRADQALIFWLLGLSTLFLLSLNAYAVFASTGVVPSGVDIVTSQAAIFSKSWGVFGEKLFLAMAFMMLFSAMWTIINAFTRIVSDILFVNSHVGPFQKLLTPLKSVSQSKVYYSLIGILVVAQAILVPFNQPLTYLVITSVLGGVSMAIYVPILMYLNNRRLAKPLRPSIFTNLVLGTAALLYTVLTVVVAASALHIG